MEKQKKTNLQLKVKKYSFYTLLSAVILSAYYFVGLRQPDFAGIEGSTIVHTATASVPAVKEPTVEEYVMNEIEKAGINKYEAWAIINCESRWNPNTFNLRNKDGSADFGLWQLNSYWQIQKKGITPACAFDYRCSTSEVIKIRLADGNWHQWACAKILGIK